MHQNRAFEQCTTASVLTVHSFIPTHQPAMARGPEQYLPDAVDKVACMYGSLFGDDRGGGRPPSPTDAWPSP